MYNFMREMSFRDYAYILYLFCVLLPAKFYNLRVILSTFKRNAVIFGVVKNNSFARQCLWEW